MDIATNLRRLRRAKDVTQEELAERLGVTFQAVSRWERGEGFPEITMLPMLSAYFGVTLDELCGVDEARKDERLRELSERLTDYYASDKHERAALIHGLLEDFDRAIHNYPDDFNLLMMYASLEDQRIDDEQPFKERALRVYERAYERSDNEIIRQNALNYLCRAYAERGETERALKLADGLRNKEHTRRYIKPQLARGEQRVNMYRAELDRNLTDLITQISAIAHTQEADETYVFTPEERIAMLRRCAEIIELAYEGDDFAIAFNTFPLYSAINNNALADVENIGVDRLLDTTEAFADVCVRMDTAPFDGVVTGALLYGMEFKRITAHTLPHVTGACTAARQWLAIPDFDVVRDHPRFAAVMEKINQYPQPRNQT